MSPPERVPATALPRTARRLLAGLALVPALAGAAPEPGCPGSARPDPAVLFCDGFEAPRNPAGTTPWYGEGRWKFAEPGSGRGGTASLAAHWEPGRVGAGGAILLFGRLPPDGVRTTPVHPDRDFRDVYWRFFLRMASPWPMRDPGKLTRAYVFSHPGHWGQAAILHLWSGPAPVLDPVSAVTPGADGDRVRAVGYNDFEHFEWLGLLRGRRPIYRPEDADRWICVEVRFRLNDPGRRNGVAAYWIDDELQARRGTLDFTGAWTGYGINALALENYVNDGAPAAAHRYMDDLVVATRRIGCGEPGAERNAAPAPD